MEYGFSPFSIITWELVEKLEIVLDWVYRFPAPLEVVSSSLVVLVVEAEFAVVSECVWDADEFTWVGVLDSSGGLQRETHFINVWKY